MTYVYECPSCKRQFDVIKRVAEMDEPDACTCGGQAQRIFVPTRVLFSGAAVQHAEYNPGLGCITRNAAHRGEIAKSKGLTEVGNEKPESIHKYFDKTREERREKSWADADKGWVGAE